MNRTDGVDHPAHYQRDGRRECIEEIHEALGDYGMICFCIGNAHKYMYRKGLKGDAMVDLRKAGWYLDYGKEILGSDYARMTDDCSEIIRLCYQLFAYKMELCEMMEQEKKAIHQKCGYGCSDFLTCENFGAYHCTMCERCTGNADCYDLYTGQDDAGQGADGH